MSKKMTSVTIPVDFEKLYKLFANNGTTAKEVSEALGWNRYYIENSERAGRGLRLSVIRMIESMYGIKYAAYKPEEIPEPADPKEETEHRDLKQIELELQTLRQEHNEINKALIEIAKELKIMQETQDRTYNNTVNMRQAATETWKASEAILTKLGQMEINEKNTAENIAMISNRTKETLNRLKGYR